MQVGGWGGMAIDSPLGVEVLFLLFLLCFHQTLATGCVFLVWVCFFHAFFGALVCVWNVVFLPNEYMHSQNNKFGDSLIFHMSSSICPFYLSQTVLESKESQLQIMSHGPKMISTL